MIPALLRDKRASIPDKDKKLARLDQTTTFFTKNATLCEVSGPIRMHFTLSLHFFSVVLQDHKCLTCLTRFDTQKIHNTSMKK